MNAVKKNHWLFHLGFEQNQTAQVANILARKARSAVSAEPKRTNLILALTLIIPISVNYNNSCIDHKEI